MIYGAELLDPTTLPYKTRWAEEKDVSSLRTVLKDQLNERDVPYHRAPWYKTGFYKESNHWLEVESAKAGFKLINSEQVKVSDITMVQKAKTDKEDLYFKATTKVSHFENSLTEHLSFYYPRKSVSVVTTHSKEPWFIMKDLSGTPLRQLKNKELWKKALQEYAQLQVEETKHIDKVIQMGVPDRRIHVLKKNIQDHLLEMCQTGLSDKETSEVMAIQSELLDMCNQIEGSIPNSIDHGDLHSNNIQFMKDDPFFFDWGDASVTHPFFSTRVFWNAIDELVDSEDEWLKMVDYFRPYYLEPWTVFASMHELEKILLISDQLSCVHRGLGWHLYINPNRENIKESERRPSQWLQVLLEHRNAVAK